MDIGEEEETYEIPPPPEVEEPEKADEPAEAPVEEPEKV